MSSSFRVPLQEGPHPIRVGTPPFGMEVRPVALELIGVIFFKVPATAASDSGGSCLPRKPIDGSIFVKKINSRLCLFQWGEATLAGRPALSPCYTNVLLQLIKSRFQRVAVVGGKLGRRFLSGCRPACLTAKLCPCWCKALRFRSSIPTFSVANLVQKWESTNFGRNFFHL